jgi:hypothetical protein
MWRQEMLPSILHGCHFDNISSFSIKMSSRIFLIKPIILIYVDVIFWVVAPCGRWISPYKSVRHYNPEDKHRHFHRRENLRSQWHLCFIWIPSWTVSTSIRIVGQESEETPDDDCIPSASCN